MRSLGVPELIILLGVALLPLIFYVRTLKEALGRCSPEARTMRPGLLWLMLILGFNLFWHFVVVVNVARSLHNEFVKRRITGMPANPGLGVGLAMCMLSLGPPLAIGLSIAAFAARGGSPSYGPAGVFLAAIPLATLAGWAGFICWIVYWAKISRCSRRLQFSSASAA